MSKFTNQPDPDGPEATGEFITLDGHRIFMHHGVEQEEAVAEAAKALSKYTYEKLPLGKMYMTKEVAYRVGAISWPRYQWLRLKERLAGWLGL